MKQTAISQCAGTIQASAVLVWRRGEIGNLEPGATVISARCGWHFAAMLWIHIAVLMGRRGLFQDDNAIRAAIGYKADKMVGCA